MTEILIADDNAQNLYLLETILKGRGYKVKLTSNGVEALKLALAKRPDAIVADILMPEMDGFELCRRCKSDERLQDIPFIFYTATYTDLKDEQFALSLGADRFIIKPEQPEVLVQIIQEVLASPRTARAAPQKISQKDEKEVLQRYNKVLFHKLEQKVSELEDSLAKQKVVEDELRESEQKYRTLISQSPDGIFIADLEGNFRSVNKVMCESLKYSEKELLSLSIWAIVPEEYVLLHKKRMADILAGKTPNEAAEYIVKGKDGRVNYVEILSAPYYEGKKLVGFQGIARDITERKKAQETLRNSEQNFRNIFENTAQSIAVVQGGKIIFGNPVLEKTTGYTVSELAGMDGFQLIHPDDQAMVQDYTARRQRGEPVPAQYQLRFKNKAGETRWLERRISDITWAGERAALVLDADITENKKAEEKVRESVQNFRNSIDNSPVGILVLSADVAESSFLYANQALLDIYGCCSLQEFQAIPAERRFTPQGYSGYLERIEKRLRGEPLPDSYETSIVRKDGEVRYLQVFIKNVVWEGKKQNQIINIDITDRKLAEEQTNRAKALLQTVIDSTPDRIAVKDTRHRYLLANKTLADAVNLPPQDIVGKLDDDVLSQEQIAGNPAKGIRSVYNDDTAALGGKIVHGISNYTGSDNKLKMYDTYRMPLRDSEGNIYGVLAYNRDITELYTATENLKESYEKVQKVLDETVAAIAKICETRDPYTAGHQNRAAQLACAISAEMGMGEEVVSYIKTGATLHDIGKLYVPAEILSKPGKLTEIEFALIKNHPQLGYDIVKNIDFPSVVAQVILQHHERLDGSGYPNHLTAGDISSEAKIMAVADVVEAMSSNRPYRPSLGMEKAIEEINKNKGTLYDEAVVDACTRLFNEKQFKFE